MHSLHSSKLGGEDDIGRYGLMMTTEVCSTRTTTSCCTTLLQNLSEAVPTTNSHALVSVKINIVYSTRMWANTQRDGRLPNIGGALCSTPQTLADAHYLSAVQ